MTARGEPLCLPSQRLLLKQRKGEGGHDRVSWEDCLLSGHQTSSGSENTCARMTLTSAVRGTQGTPKCGGSGHSSLKSQHSPAPPSGNEVHTGGHINHPTVRQLPAGPGSPGSLQIRVSAGIVSSGQANISLMGVGSLKCAKTANRVASSGNVVARAGAGAQEMMMWFETQVRDAFWSRNGRSHVHLGAALILLLSTQPA